MEAEEDQQQRSSIVAAARLLLAHIETDLNVIDIAVEQADHWIQDERRFRSFYHVVTFRRTRLGWEAIAVR